MLEKNAIAESRLPVHCPSRRDLFKVGACGLGHLALASLATEAAASRKTLAPKPPHFRARAKRVIFMYMRGGPSHVDTFDYKPKLETDHGKKGKMGHDLMQARWKFHRRGESGLWISELFPHIARRADDLCVIRSMQTDSGAHPTAQPLLHTGSFQFTRPSIGSWVFYGLGAANENLPGFITINPSRTFGGPANYGSAFLPSAYQGTRIGWESQSLQDAQIQNLTRSDLPDNVQRKPLSLVQSMNRRLLKWSAGDSQIEGVIDSFDLAWQMREAIADALDVSRESKTTLEMYGIDQKPTDNFGRQCLMARRLCEAGVRFVELGHGGWDQHGDIAEHQIQSQKVDQPIAALLTDLKRRGLLEETLLFWGGEFGRRPEIQHIDNSPGGRGHNAEGYTIWLAGGGVRGGMAYGETDEYGYEAVSDKVHLHDLHATMLFSLGLDHQQLTYRYAGRDFRLTDVYGRVVNEIMA